MFFDNLESTFHLVGLGAITIIAVLNPFGNLPQFLAMTDEVHTPLRQKLFRNILWTALLIVLIFLLTGSFIMQYLFRVNLDSVRVAGGGGDYPYCDEFEKSAFCCCKAGLLRV
ncbi:MarC family protein [Helicobacter cinaedi]|uniref:MarC family protein n=2 Tax=Helicobacter cinaedi TaxID=213 RepID=UPI001FF7B264|nr:MarC family protein [Helicobacter cinaedi]